MESPIIQFLSPLNENPNYLISDHGNLWSKNINKFMNPATDKDGYKVVNISTNGIKKTRKIARLVCEHFLDNWDPKLQVDHIDRDRSNNHYTNLRMLSHIGQCHNKGLYKTNTSGFLGVTFTSYSNGKPRSKPWRVYIRIKGFSDRRKYFKTAEEAGKWYLEEKSKLNIELL